VEFEQKKHSDNPSSRTRGSIINVGFEQQQHSGSTRYPIQRTVLNDQLIQQHSYKPCNPVKTTTLNFRKQFEQHIIKKAKAIKQQDCSI
jgi:hypothetical protein